jgi:hypothetical protein
MLYHVTRNGQNYGPYTLEDLQKYVASGNVLATDLAKTDDMAEWVPVSQVLGVAMPAISPAPLAAYAGAPGEYPQTAAIYPDPPNLHWALVLLIGIFTCGIFFIVWFFVEAAWVRKVDPQSKAMLYYIVAIVLDIANIPLQIILKTAAFNGTGNAAISSILSPLIVLAVFVLTLVAAFSMRDSIEAHFNGPEPIGLSLSGVMTFFFAIFYFQYHFSRINELKQMARLRGASI